MVRSRTRGLLRASARTTRSTRQRKQDSTPPAESPAADDSLDQQLDQSTPPSPEEAEPDELQTPAQASDQPQEPSQPSTPQTIQSVPRKRRGPGRPPRNRGPDRGTPDTGGDDGDTPRGRKRGRPSGAGWSTRGTRGRGRGARGPSHVTRVPIDKEGNMMDVVDDEVDLPEDPEGETKVDKFGRLQGDREYRVRTFTLLGRGNRLYMLSTEPARCTGFRDSYLFFTKHPRLFKIIIDDDEKRDLIEREVLPHSYKGRAIGVVTARSVFREFGARIVVGGKKVTDDYYPKAAKERGDKEGELADPYDRLPPPGESYNRNQYVAWHGASAVYHTNAPSAPIPGARPVLGKRKATVTSANWMLEHAREASRFNSLLADTRRATNDGVYDPHTNLRLYPGIMQPTHARWQRLPTPPPDDDDAAPPAKRHKPLPNGDSAFAPVPRIIARNFLVVDTHLETAPHAAMPPPGPHPELTRTTTLPAASPELLADLPPECRVAFLKAKTAEQEWRGRWSVEDVDGGRAKLKIGVGNI